MNKSDKIMNMKNLFKDKLFIIDKILTVSNGNLTITAPSRSAAISTDYVKVPIIISSTMPYYFKN